MVDFSKIDISKLNEDFLKWAKEADEQGNKDSKLLNSAFELDYVRTKALQSGLKKKEVASVFQNAGISKKEVNSIIDGTMLTESKKSAKTMRKHVDKYLDSHADKFVNNGDWDNYINTVTENITKDTHSNPQYYQQLSAEIRTVANIIKKMPQGSRKEIEQLYDKVKKELDLKPNDPYKSFKLDILEKFVDMTEARQKNIEKRKFAEQYETFRKQGKSRTEAFEATKNFTDKNGTKVFTGSYYENYVHIEEQESAVAKDGVISEFENNDIVQDASKEVYNLISGMFGNEKLTTSRQVEDEVIEKLKKSKGYDKYAKKVLRGQLSFSEKIKFEKSDIKSYRKTVAAYNRAENAKHTLHDKSEFTDALKHDEVFEALLAGGLIEKKTDNGKEKYDLTKLSDLIKAKIGANFRADRQIKDFDVLKEIKRVAGGLFAGTSPHIEVTDSDAKALIKLCGFDVESKNWAKVFYDAIIGTAVDSLAGLAAYGLTVAAMDSSKEYPTSFNFDKNYPINIIHGNNEYLELNLNLGLNISNKTIFQNLDNIIMNNPDIADFITLEKIDGGLRLVVDYSNKEVTPVILKIQEELKDTTTLEELGADPKKDIASALIKTTLIKFGMNLLMAALNDKTIEQPVIPTQFETTDVERYLNEYVYSNNKLTPSMKEAVKNIALSFVEMENGVPKEGVKWDAEGFKKVINRIAGDAGVVNRKELVAGSNILNHNPKILVTEDNKKSPKIEEDKKPKAEKPIEEDKKTKAEKPIEEVKKKDPDPGYDVKSDKDDDISIDIRTVKYRSWADTVNGYDILKTSPYNKVIVIKGRKIELNRRIVKVIQAIDTSNIKNQTMMQDVYDIDKLAAFAEDAIRFGIDKAMQKNPNMPINKTLYQQLLSADAGLKGDVAVPDLYKKKEDESYETINWSKKQNVNIKKGGSKTATIEKRTVVIEGKVHYYKRKVGESQWIEIGQAEYNELSKRNATE